MADVHIESEQEIESGWRFAVRVESGAPGRADNAFTLTLSWADYNHWSSGTEPPSEIARDVIEFVLARRSAADLPTRFDAATIRRWLPQIDQALGRRR